MILRVLCLTAALLAAGCQSGSRSDGGLPASSGSLALTYRESGGLPDGRSASIVVDAGSGKVLYAENEDALRYPASLTKMMTLYVLFEEMESGRVGPNTPLTVSRNAAAQPASKLGLRAGSTIRVEDAVASLAVKSANDVATVVAENLAGSEQAFAARMTRTARSLGMRSTNFTNASGLPDQDQVTTAEDMAILAAALQQRFPRHYANFSRRSFAYDGKTFQNTNKLLGEVPGMDFGKTGYTRAAGYNLATSIRRGGKRIIVVVMGEPSGAARNAHVTALVGEYMPERTGWFGGRS